MRDTEALSASGFQYYRNTDEKFAFSEEVKERNLFVAPELQHHAWRHQFPATMGSRREANPRQVNL